jgi:glycosyltransferase involved in cell wall biosynthesis
VVLPTRGRPELVRETLTSIVGQDYPGPLEILVIHDQEPMDPSLAEFATTDRSVTVLETVGHTPGLAGARNTGIDVAKGAFVATCDDDDLWHPDKLRKQVKFLSDHPELLVVGAGIRLLMPEDRIVEWPGRSERIELSTLLRNRVKELHSSTLVMRADTFAKAGMYDETLPHGYAEDYDFVLKVARVGRIGIVVEPLADIRKNVQSWFRERAENTASALEHMLVIHPELKTSRRGYARILGQIAFARSTLGERRLAIRYVGRAIVQWPFAPHAYLALVQITTGVEPRQMLKLARVFGRGLS